MEELDSQEQQSVCPVCGWPNTPIVYGLPKQEDFGRTDIVLGGCVVGPFDPEICCSNCDWVGQEWALTTPLSPSVWIVLDPTETLAPIGLVAGRFDEVIEVFQLGFWLNVTFTKQYEEWLEAAPDRPLALTAPFDELSPGLIADFRRGSHRFTREELYEAGFVGLIRPPRFEFDGRMKHSSQTDEDTTY